MVKMCKGRNNSLALSQLSHQTLIPSTRVKMRWRDLSLHKEKGRMKTLVKWNNSSNYSNLVQTHQTTSPCHPTSRNFTIMFHWVSITKNLIITSRMSHQRKRRSQRRKRWLKKRSISLMSRSQLSCYHLRRDHRESMKVTHKSSHPVPPHLTKRMSFSTKSYYHCRSRRNRSILTSRIQRSLVHTAAHRQPMTTETETGTHHSRMTL